MLKKQNKTLLENIVTVGLELSIHPFITQTVSL